MTIREASRQQARAFTLDNGRLRCTVLPAHGAKVASLYLHERAFELLFQNPGRAYRTAWTGAPFDGFEACGFDDAFPSIDAEVVELEGGPVQYPDHGEIWSAAFDCRVQGDALHCRYESPLLGYLYEKSFRLEGDNLVCRYYIHNRGTRAFPYIWACHCLVRYEPDMRLLFPRGTASVENVLAGSMLGDAGQTHSFPVGHAGGAPYDFTQVPPAGEGVMAKYYVNGKVAEGYCGYRYPTQGVLAELRYDSALLPYLGFWVTAGGFRGDCNCALEPATGYYDSVGIAGQRGTLSWLNPGESLSFVLSIGLRENSEL